MTHQLVAVAVLGGPTLQWWGFVCSCGEVHKHRQRRAAWASFAVHAHYENKILRA